MRVQLLAPILVATLGLAFLGFLQTADAVTLATDAQRAKFLASTAVETVRLVHEVERELAETTALRQRGGKAGLQLVTAQRQRTDEAIKTYRRTVALSVKTTPQLEPVMSLADAALDGLVGARAMAMDPGSGSDRAYQNLTTALLNVADDLPARVMDPALANMARAVAALSAVEHYDALERAAVRGMFAKKRVDPGELGTLAMLIGQRDERMAEFDRVADTHERATYSAIVHGGDVETAERMRAALLNVETDRSGVSTDPDAWYTAQSNLIRRINLVGIRLSERLEQAAADVEVVALRRAWGIGVGTVSVGLLALVTAIVLAVRTSRRLRKLRAAALTVARRELPDAILAVTTGAMPESEDGGLSASGMTRQLAAANDEIGQVADAFASVHRTALQLAGEQAELRVDVSRMVEILARRIRTLITRQLRLLDEFEREETDPEVLARLFALDHLAARLRRNGENLLVLAGGEPGRSYSQPFQLSAVVTAAASEIEDFTRIESAVGDVMIASGAVADVVRVLAELLENAASFSPPNVPVRVDARRTVDGAIVRVHDSGIGITTARLAEINARLAQPASLTSAAAGTMGLHVVSHLAARHGIRVQLHPTGTGTVAYVMLPHTALATQAALASQVTAVAGHRNLPIGGRTPYSRQALMSGGSPAGDGVRPAWVLTPSQARQGSIDDDGGGGGRVGAMVEAEAAAGVEAGAASQQPATWFSPYAGTGDDSEVAARPATTPLVWATPEDGSALMATTTTAPANSNGGDDGAGGLPRRHPGALLAPEVAATTRVPSRTAADVVDPETVRARLSAFAEGVSAAARRTALSSQSTKDR